MKLALDSNVVIDLINDDAPHVRSAFQSARRRGDELHASPQVVHEAAYGAFISARPMHQAEALHNLVTLLLVAPFTDADATLSARLRADRRKAGRALAAVDAMIAAQAVARGWTLVTADVDDFALIPGLLVIDWRSPQTTSQD